jgi:hypothetical protein
VFGEVRVQFIFEGIAVKGRNATNKNRLKPQLEALELL